MCETHSLRARANILGQLSSAVAAHDGSGFNSLGTKRAGFGGVGIGFGTFEMLCLSAFDDFLNAQGVLFLMAVTLDRIRTARAFDQDVRPKDTRLDANAGHALKMDAHFIFGEQGSLAPNHSGFRHFDASGEKVVALGPAARLELLDCHSGLPFTTCYCCPSYPASAHLVREETMGLWRHVLSCPSHRCPAF